MTTFEQRSGPINDLRQAVAVLEASGDPAAARVALAIQSYVHAAPGELTMEQALKLRSGRGGVGNWKRAEALRRRNELLRQAHRDHYLGCPAATAARSIAALIPRRAGEHSSAPGDLGPLIDQIVTIGLSVNAATPTAAGIRRVLCEQSPIEMHALECTRIGS